MSSRAIRDRTEFSSCLHDAETKDRRESFGLDRLSVQRYEYSSKRPERDQRIDDHVKRELFGRSYYFRNPPNPSEKPWSLENQPSPQLIKTAEFSHLGDCQNKRLDSLLNCDALS